MVFVDCVLNKGESVTEREQEIIRMALIYLSANLDNAIEAFGGHEPDAGDTLDLNGETIVKPHYDEIGDVLDTL
jgi:hypothetical protein